MKRKPKTSRNAGRKRAGARNSAPRMSEAAVRRLGAVVLWSATIAALVYGLGRIDAFAAQAGPSNNWELEWSDLPLGLDDWIPKEVAMNAGLADGGSLRQIPLSDEELCDKVAAAIGHSAWVAGVKQVAKTADGTVRVQARFRRYVTFVVRGGMGFLIDADGVRLPREQTASSLDKYDMLLLEGVAAAPPPAGERWTGDDVAGGLKLIRYLDKHCPADLRRSLRAVDVANYGDRLNRQEGWLRIRTIHPNHLVRWGIPPGEEYDIEIPAAQKLQYLWGLYAKEGQLPDLPAIDLRDKDWITWVKEP